MAATPYTGTLTFRGKSGTPYIYPISGSDVADALVTFTTSGLTFQTMPTELVQLVDMVLSASGVDTTRLELLVNGNPTNLSFLDGTILKTIQQPRLTAFPWVAPGATLQLRQKTT